MTRGRLQSRQFICVHLSICFGAFHVVIGIDGMILRLQESIAEIEFWRHDVGSYENRGVVTQAEVSGIVFRDSAS